MARRTGNSLQNQILAIIDGLPSSKLETVFERMEFPDIENDERVRLARATLIDYLNRNRRERARRLFTSLFEPFLTSDPVLLRCPAVPPGLFHRLDIGGLWRALTHFGMEDLAARIQSSLDELSRSMLLERALRSDEAAAMRDEMRLKAIALLDQIRAPPRNGERSGEEVLGYMNRHRARDAGRIALYAGEPYRLDKNFLGVVASYLRHWAVLSDAAQSVRDECREADANQVEDLAHHLEELVDELQDGASPDAPPPKLTALIPLAALHAARRYDVVSTHLRYLDSSTTTAAVLVEGLLCHFDGVLLDVEAILMGALRIHERVAGAPVRLSPRERAEIETDLQRTRQLVEAAATGGLLELRATAPVLLDRWRRFARFMNGFIVPIQVQRFTAAIMARGDRVIDHDMAVWLAWLVAAWDAVGHAIEPEAPAFPQWRASRLEDLQIATEKAFRFDGREDVPDRFRHLRRLNEFYDIFDDCAGRDLPVSSRNTVDVVRYCLSNRTLLGRRETDFVDDFLSRAEAELARVRNWKSPELDDLVKLAKTTGFRSET